MTFYHKISGPFLRDAKGKLTNEWSDEAFSALQNAEWEFTEKVDGTNIRVIWDGYRVSFGGRTDNAQIPADLINYLNDLFGGPVNEQKFEQKFGEMPAVFYGEGYGKKIQKVGELYSQTQKFVLFDVKICNLYLSRADVCDIGLFFEVEQIPWRGNMTLNEGIELITHGVVLSTWGDFEAEGFVGTPVGGLLNRQGRRIIVKLKKDDLRSSNA